jgi:hypothetical protein
MSKAVRVWVLAAAALGAAAAAPGCIAVPPEVQAELSPPDGVRPNHYHACAACARAKKERARNPAAVARSDGGTPCAAAH